MSKLAIVGSRDWPNLEVVRDFVRKLGPDMVIVTGGAEGVDQAAEAEARICRLPEPRIIRPDYKTHHPKLAPKVRNRQIAYECDAMMAFWDGNSGGTANAIAWAAFTGRSSRS